MTTMRMSLIVESHRKDSLIEEPRNKDSLMVVLVMMLMDRHRIDILENPQ